MASSVKNARRREQRKHHRTEERQALFLKDYIEHKYADIHAEAVRFYDHLNQLYPTKQDLRKTIQYRSWKMTSIQTRVVHEDQPSSEQPETPGESPPYTDNMQLRIPLLEPPANHPNAVTDENANHPNAVTDENANHPNAVTDENANHPNAVTEEDLQPSLCQELSPEVLDKIISELQADPDIQNLFADIEHQLDFEELGMDIDMDIDIDIEKW